ncbi:hypothetical protein FRB99_001298 [Tulasnella sp. 403]|nr:hypothetical protein FRB99_001298 [Tulasnella sp. 403]
MDSVSSNQPAPPFSERFTALKKAIADPHKDAIVASWKEILDELAVRTKVYAETGPEIIPQVDFSELSSLSKEQIDRIKRIGSVVIRNVVDDTEARGYKEALEEYVKANPGVEGFPESHKQFFEIYWSTSQLRARSHPNVFTTGVWLNNLWHAQSTDVVDLNHNLSYSDRFRIRQPSKIPWNAHAPHVDGASTERWEDASLQRSFGDILNGNWKTYDPYDITNRLTANTDMYNRPNQASIFRTFQGWLAMSDTGPGEGTLRVFPDLLLANAYITLRPFFRPVNPNLQGDELLDASNWVFDTSYPEIPGISIFPDGHFTGLGPTDEMHPHLRLESAIVSMPRVQPGDMVFWHCDVIHSVETHHNGPSDSSVMYIPAVPLTPQNVRYLAKHREHFLKRMPPPDFPQGIGEASFVNQGLESDISGPEGRLAMGLERFEVDDGAREGAREAVKAANTILGFA